MIRIIQYLPFLVLLWNCGSPQTDRGSDSKAIADSTADVITSTNTFTKDTLTYVYQKVRTESEYLSGDADMPDTSFYQINYPVFSQDRVNALVRDAIFVEGELDAQQAAQAFIDGYNEFVEEETTQYVTAWVRDMESKVIVQTPRLLSICTRVYEYTGGAHGHSVAIWNNYDLQNMRKITIQDLLDEQHLPTLTAIAEQKFRAAEGLAADSPLDKDFFFIDGIFALNDNFGFTEKDLIFYYNEYEIKPYAQGSTTIRISYEELADILNPSGRAYLSSINKQTR